MTDRADGALAEQLARLLEQRLQVSVPAPDTDLIATGVLDSLMLVDVILLLEEEFGVTVDVGDLQPEHFGSVDAMAAYVAARG